MTEIQGWSAWADKYKPIKNKFSNDPNSITFETYGEEYEYVKSMHPNFVWTNVQGDMSDLIVAGRAYVNRLSYYITENPWEDENDYVLVSVEKECACYDEDAMDRGERQEYGDPNCTECEGYGLVTEYVD